jgi:hypothetical protein
MQTSAAVLGLLRRGGTILSGYMTGDDLLPAATERVGAIVPGNSDGKPAEVIFADYSRDAAARVP